MSIYTFSEAELRSRFIKNIGNRDDIDVYIEVPVFCRSVDLVIQEKENAEIFAIEFNLFQISYIQICGQVQHKSYVMLHISFLLAIPCQLPILSSVICYKRM